MGVSFIYMQRLLCNGSNANIARQKGTLSWNANAHRRRRVAPI